MDSFDELRAARQLLAHELAGMKMAAQRAIASWAELSNKMTPDNVANHWLAMNNLRDRVLALENRD